MRAGCGGGVRRYVNEASRAGYSFVDLSLSLEEKSPVIGSEGEKDMLPSLSLPNRVLYFPVLVLLQDGVCDVMSNGLVPK